jgi:Phage DNA packaging protein, Nu1 subunit of terminase
MAKALTIDKGQLAQLLDITPRHVQRLTGDGILTRARDVDGKELMGRYELIANVRSYIKYLRMQARLDDASESKYVMLRNNKMAADSETATLKLAIFKNTLHKADDVEFILTNMFTAMKSRLLAIPSRVTRLVIGQVNFQVIYDLIYTEIELALRELADYNPMMFKRQNDAYLASQGADPTSLNGEAYDSSDDEDEEQFNTGTAGN